MSTHLPVASPVRGPLALAIGCLIAVVGCAQPTPDQATTHDDHILRVAGVLPTPIEEPWPQVVDQAFRDVAASGRIEYSAEYGIGEEAFEEALHRAARAGNDIVVGDTFAAEADARRIAAEHPEVRFFFGSGLGPAEPNASVFDSWLQEASYLAGMAAGYASESHRIGVVAAIPGPETNRVLQGFLAGAREADAVSCLAVAYTGTWFDTALAAEEGRTLIADGADVLYAERLGAEQAAAEHLVPVIGNFLDQRDAAPEVTLTSVLWSMRPAVEHLVRTVEHEKFHAHEVGDATEAELAFIEERIEDFGPWSSLVMGGSSLAPWTNTEGWLSAEEIELIEVRRRSIVDGLFRVPVIELQVAECE